MNFITYSHRYAETIISSEPNLSQRYNEFTSVIHSITDEELIADFILRRDEHIERGTDFKSLTPSINGLLKAKIDVLPGWRSEVDIFNDTTGIIGNTEWRLDFACDDALCIEVAFNHGEAIAWNLLKPVLSCELNHVQKAVQGKVGVYVCATDLFKISGNIDSASGSYEKVLRYLAPMMNQLTIPIVIIGLLPLDSFKVSKKAEIIYKTNPISNPLIDTWINTKVRVTYHDYHSVIGVVTEFFPRNATTSPQICLEKSQNNTITISEDEIMFIEPYIRQ